MTEIKQYSERDAMELDKVGGYYFRHVLAMTADGLHSKSDIAAELGWRDMQIDALQEQVREMAELEALLRECRAALDALIENKPTLSGLLCGSTTLGNLRASLYRFRNGTNNTAEGKHPIKAIKISEHSGCGHGIQVDMITVRMKRDDVVVQMSCSDFKRLSGEQS